METRQEEVARYQKTRWIGGPIAVVGGTILLLVGQLWSIKGVDWPVGPICLIVLGIVVLAGFGRFARTRHLGHYAGERSDPSDL